MTKKLTAQNIYAVKTLIFTLNKSDNAVRLPNPWQSALETLKAHLLTAAASTTQIEQKKHKIARLNIFMTLALKLSLMNNYHIAALLKKL